MEKRTDFFNRYGSMDMLNIALEGGMSDADDPPYPNFDS